MARRARKPAVVVPLDRPLLALGLEGSANKLGVGLVLHSPSPDTPEGTVSILSNIRHTYVTPPGEGFLPSDTARHHKRWAIEVIAKALESAGKTMDDVDVVCFTQGKWRSGIQGISSQLDRRLICRSTLCAGPGMWGPLQTVALVARTLALMYNKPLVGVNHCVGRK